MQVTADGSRLGHACAPFLSLLSILMLLASCEASGCLHYRLHVNARPDVAKSQLQNAGLLVRSRLRRGCQCHAVHAVLYVGHMQGRSDSANTSGQVATALICALTAASLAVAHINVLVHNVFALAEAI